MKRWLSLIYTLVSIAVMALSSPLHAGPLDIYNINFGPGDLTYSGGAMSVADGYASTQVWNEFNLEPSVTAETLARADGSTAAGVKATLDYSGDNIVKANLASVGFTDVNKALMRGYVFASPLSDNLTVSISGLVANQDYKLYVYTQSENTLTNNYGKDQYLDLTINATQHLTQTINSSASTDHFVAGQNYLYGIYKADAGGNLNIVASPLNSSISVINGLQVAAVPEPATVALLGVGGLLTAVKTRRVRKKSIKTS